MERVEVGMHVDIRRSDGRVHSAIVSEIRHQRNAVVVEWNENGEMKGKEISMTELFAVNPMLAGKPQLSQALSQAKEARAAPKPFNALHFDDDEVEMLLPLATRRGDQRAHDLASSSDPFALANETIYAENPLPLAREAVLQATSRQENPPVVMRGSRVSKMAAPVRVSLPAKPRPSSTLCAALSNSASENSEVDQTSQPSFDKKSTTVLQIERVQKQRNERRAQQEEIKKKREAEKAVDPSNPNYQFLTMIRDYQIDYRPLKLTDAVRDNKITVCVRKRPMSKKEIARKEIEVITIPNQDHVIVHQPQQKVDLTKYLDNQKFRFDYAFDENVDNTMVYKFTAQPLVHSIFEQGFATCFAYGQTGSGKTHTMGGDFTGKAQDCSKGIYALAASDVFKLQRGEFRHLGLTVFDLLKKKCLLRVLEDGNKEVQVVGLQEQKVTADQQVLDLIKAGSDMRTAGTTSANSNSSRSHAVFQIILRDKASKVWGKFSLIDLAGNERGQDTGNSDRQTRMEGAEINKSLLALKECIRAMGRSSAHVPFRQSKLTMVLRDSFIAMISPSMASCEHSLNTLRYADRVKELGLEDGDAVSPMRDDELFMNDPDADVEDVISCVKGGGKSDLKLEKLLAALTQCESKVFADQFRSEEMHVLESREGQKLMQRADDPNYDMEEFAKDWVGQLEQQISDRRAMLDNANKWIKIIQAEAELSAKMRKK